MKFRVCRSIDEWRLVMGGAPSVVTVGNFDGVHLGHQAILARVVALARARGERAAAIIFDPHPLKVLRPESAVPLVTTLAERLDLLAGTGLDGVLVLPFTPEFARLTPEEFVRQVIVEALGASGVLVGANFRFGHRQAGDAGLLAALGAQLGFTVELVPAVCLRGDRISSTLVRQAIAAGRVARAGRMLGRPFALAGEIRPGTGQGRRLVVPTLNLATAQELMPARGVYATEALVGGRLYRAATNVGFRPTFNGHSLTVESHLLDFAEERDSGPLELRFWKRLRDERKFSSPAELRAQVMADIGRAARFFGRLDRWRRPVAAPR
ncbi:MAG TPA: bifunctional riboflavin kinase/FAD synthetase [Candidatus Acidoferrales bacterium]|nr:bifunctional riboflavin kinase/FAD synthetase [Candidatus Acidoferrales bacterium]